MREMCRLGIVILLAAMFGAAHGQTITVQNPVSGQVFAPGSTLEVNLAFPVGFTPVHVDINWVKGHGVTSSYEHVTAPPLDRIGVQVPDEFAGPIFLSVDSQSADGQFAYAEVPLNIVPDEAPIAIDAPVSPSVLRMPGVAPVGGDKRNLSPEGLYAGDIVRDISSPVTGTTYVSFNPNVATVDSEGTAQAVGPGETFVMIENRGVRKYVTVAVKDPVTGRVPHQDLTGKVEFIPGGFRVDRARNRYVQQVMVKNISQQPLHPLMAVLVKGLPQGVTLHQPTVTRHIEPVGTPWKSPQFEELLMPGEQATLILEFKNPAAVPITYTLHPFWTDNP